jgi:hypothetical protein
MVTLTSRCSAAPPEYPWEPWNAGLMDPQPHGWPLTPEERAYVVDSAATLSWFSPFSGNSDSTRIDRDSEEW